VTGPILKGLIRHAADILSEKQNFYLLNAVCVVINMTGKYCSYCSPTSWSIYRGFSYHDIMISYDTYSHTRQRQSSDADGGHTSIYWSDRQWCTVCRCVHLQMQIHRIVRIYWLIWIKFFQFSCNTWKLVKDIRKLWLIWILSQDITGLLFAVSMNASHKFYHTGWYYEYRETFRRGLTADCTCSRLW